MPIFEYVCRGCNHHFEAIVMGSQTPKCPKCESRKLEQQLSRFAVAGKGSSADAAESNGGACGANDGGACGSCGDPRGPGACSLDDMD